MWGSHKNYLASDISQSLIDELATGSFTPGWVLLPLSLSTLQDGEVSTSLSKIISTTPPWLWRYCVTACSGGIPRKQERHKSSVWIEMYIGWLYTATGVLTLRLRCVIAFADYIEYVNSDWMHDFSAAHVSFLTASRCCCLWFAFSPSCDALIKHRSSYITALYFHTW